MESRIIIHFECGNLMNLESFFLHGMHQTLILDRDLHAFKLSYSLVKIDVGKFR